MIATDSASGFHFLRFCLDLVWDLYCISVRFGLIWLLAFIYYDFVWIWLDFSLISVGFRFDFGLIWIDFSLIINLIALIAL